MTHPGENRLVHRAMVGDIEVTAVGDGYLNIDPKMLPAADPGEARALLDEAFLPDALVRTYINTFVVIAGETRILIDAGIGAGIAPTAGHHQENLAAAGISPKTIDVVLLTHLHRDHVRGLTGADGAALFPTRRFGCTRPNSLTGPMRRKN